LIVEARRGSPPAGVRLIAEIFKEFLPVKLVRASAPEAS
jgi:hypothetical protein